MALKLIGEVALDGSGFERGLNQMAGSVKGFIANAFGLIAVEEMFRRTMDVAKELVTASQRLGLGVEALQVLKQAAKDGGKELGDLAKMFEKIDVAREKALSGSKEGMKLLARFAQLGISEKDLRTQTAAALTMGPIHDKALSMNPEDLDPILKAFGKGLTELIPVLQTNFAQLQKKMEGLGVIMDTRTAVGLKTFADDLDILSGFIATHFGPTLLTALEKMEDGVSGFLGWMDERFRGKPPGEDPAKTGSWASGAWAFSGKVGSGMIGAATGLFGLWDSIIGDTERADERLMAADAWFKQAGLGGGWLNEAADAMVANMNAGKPSIKAAWDAIVAQRREDAAALIERLKHPVIPDLGGGPNDDKEPKEKAPRNYREHGDALIRVGNFLGSSRSALEDIGQKQVALLQRLVTVAENRQTGGIGPFTFSDDNFPPF